MTDKTIALMRHAIGLDYQKPYTRHGKKFYKPYRNYFGAAANDTEWENLMNPPTA